MLLPLIPIAVGGAKLLGGTALVGGGTALASRGIMGSLDEDTKRMLGLDDKSIAGGETYDLEEGRLSSRGLDDVARDLFFGTDSTSDVKGGIVDTAKGKALDRLYGEVNRDRLSSRLTDLGITDISGLDYTPGNDIDSYKTNVDLLRQKTALLEGIKANDGDITGLLDKSVSELTKINTDTAREARNTADDNDEYSPRSIARRQEEATKEREAEEKRRYQWEREESNKRYASEKEYRRWSTEKDDAWRKYQSQRDDARLAAERQERGLQREQNLQLAMMDREDKKADRAMAREDRLASQRQASIMALVKGLTQMGAGFAI